MNHKTRQLEPKLQVSRVSINSLLEDFQESNLPIKSVKTDMSKSNNQRVTL